MTLCNFTESIQMEPTPAAPPDLPAGIPPLRAFYLYLSTGCNLACRHCWIVPHFVDGQPDPGDVINVEALRAAVREAKPLGLRTAKLTGGEPMLHPRFREIVDLLTAEGIRSNMETNGTLVTAEMARHLKEKSSLRFVSVSLDGPDAASHDGFRGVPGAFDAALRGLDHLVAAGFANVQVIMAVHRGNRRQIEAVVRLAEAHGAASVKFNPVTSAGRGAAMHERGESLGFDEILALPRYLYGELAPRLRPRLILNIPPALRPIRDLCRTGGGAGDCGVLGILGLLGTGDIALCGIGRTIPELVYGRLDRDGIRDLWLHHPSLHALREALADVAQFPGVCRECVHAGTCRTGCVAQNYVDRSRLVWPGALCAEADARGVFPATRRYRPARARTRETRISGCPPMSKMHAAWVSVGKFDPRLPLGGLFDMVARLRFLQVRGHPVSILAFVTGDADHAAIDRALAEAGGGLERDGDIRRARYMGIPCACHMIPESRLEVRGAYQRITPRMQAALRDEGIGYAFTMDEDYWSVYSAWRQGIPGAHIFNLLPFVQHFTRNPGYVWLMRRRTVIAQSRFMQAEIGSRLGLEAALSYPFIDLAACRSRKNGARSRRIGFYSAGRRKGSQIVAEIIPRMPDVEFVVIGRYDEQPPGGHPPNLACWGRIPDIRDFYRAIDLLLVPSVHEEPFGMVIVEAAANGIPAVANREGGIPEALGGSGVLIDKEPNPAAMAEKYVAAIRPLLDDDGLYRRHRRRALQRAAAYEREHGRMALEFYRRLAGTAGWERQRGP